MPMANMDKKKFYAELRRPEVPMFGAALRTAQVKVIDAILDRMRHYPLDEVAYVLATAYHEAKCIPTRENMNYTAASRIMKVWPTRFPTITEAKKFVRKPQELANRVYGGRLGNYAPDDGWKYRGGGLDQLTGRDNYRMLSPKVGHDLVADPEALLDPKIAVECLVTGMTEGLYRGVRLRDCYIDGQFNGMSARRIVNADTKVNGVVVYRHYEDFRNALLTAGYQQIKPPATTSNIKRKDVEVVKGKPSKSLWTWLKEKFGG